jgi:putative ABC transport system permease protein
VIGSEAKYKLFSGRNFLGEHIRIDGLGFEIVGVLSAKMQEGTAMNSPVTTISSPVQDVLLSDQSDRSLWRS